jgi:8-oxo-dGTP diphosphatase
MINPLHVFIYPMQKATLVLPIKGDPVSEVLLGYKKIGFGQGKYTGFGGKVEPGESVVEAALREFAEETGIVISDPQTLEYAALLQFRFPRKRSWSQDVSVFTLRTWEGQARESNEMIPQWFRLEEIPYRQMWEDARHWLPLVLLGEKFGAKFRFRGDNATVARVIFTDL